MPELGPFRRIYDPSVGEVGSWYYNDHSFIRGRDGTWHVFAITHAEPANPEDERVLGHATAPSLSGPWTKQAAPLVVDESVGERVLWAPHLIEHLGLYYMFYTAGGEPSAFQIKVATSTDLSSWTRRQAPLFTDGAYARDPFVIRIGQKWVMYYTATSMAEGGNHVVAYRTSADLFAWGPRNIAFRDPLQGDVGGNTESPFLVERPEGFYLFLSLRGAYDATEVFFSTDPFVFDSKALVQLRAHAAEVVTDSDGASHLSHCGWGQGGLYLAPMQWSCAVRAP